MIFECDYPALESFFRYGVSDVAAPVLGPNVVKRRSHGQWGRLGANVYAKQKTRSAVHYDLCMVQVLLAQPVQCRRQQCHDAQTQCLEPSELGDSGRVHLQGLRTFLDSR